MVFLLVLKTFHFSFQNQGMHINSFEIRFRKLSMFLPKFGEVYRTNANLLCTSALLPRHSSCFTASAFCPENRSNGKGHGVVGGKGHGRGGRGRGKTHDTRLTKELPHCIHHLHLMMCPFQWMSMSICPLVLNEIEMATKVRNIKKHNNHDNDQFHMVLKVSRTN